MPEQKRNNSEVQKAVKDLFMGVAPERQSELTQLWEQYQIRFNILQNDSFVMEAGAYRDVNFNNRALRAFWVAAFAAWEGFCVSSRCMGDLARFKILLECVDNIMSSNDPAEVLMPQGVPEPGIFVDTKDDAQARAAGEFAVFACGWALLHEVHHIQLQQQGLSTQMEAPSTDKREQELKCDCFATEFILKDAAKYARNKEIDIQLLEQKRQVGVHFALFALTIISRRSWIESESHPTIQERIDKAWSQMNIQGLNFMASLISVGAFYSLSQCFDKAPGPPVLSISYKDGLYALQSQ